MNNKKDIYKAMDELMEAAEPLIKLLNTANHPHCKVIVTSTSVELLDVRISIPNILDFIED